MVARTGILRYIKKIYEKCSNPSCIKSQVKIANNIFDEKVSDTKVRKHYL